MGTCCFPKNNIIYRKDSISNTKNYCMKNGEINEDEEDEDMDDNIPVGRNKDIKDQQEEVFKDFEEIGSNSKNY